MNTKKCQFAFLKREKASFFKTKLLLLLGFFGCQGLNWNRGRVGLKRARIIFSTGEELKIRSDSTTASQKLHLCRSYILKKWEEGARKISLSVPSFWTHDCCTRSSQAVYYPSTGLTKCCLTLLFNWEQIKPTWQWNYQAVSAATCPRFIEKL